VGVGIRESLRPRYGDMTDGQAIRRAIQWHVSRIEGEGRGQGFRTSRARPSGRSSWPGGPRRTGE
jgi:hypothetical protein